MEKSENSLDLLEFVNEYGQLDFETAKSITQQLAESSLLYSKVGIAHCDLKDENVLFNPLTGQTKIIDFGNATYTDKVNHESFGTPAYYSPELKNQTAFEIDACTVYNIGCIIFTVLTGTSPFSECVDFDFQRHVQLNGDISSKERQLLSKLLATTVSQRVQLQRLL